MSDPKSNSSFIEGAIKYYMTLDHSSQIAVAGLIMVVVAVIIALLAVIIAFIYTRRKGKLAKPNYI